ncbi:hypothetical protein [Streptomyces sp. NPDC047706]|uniref:hypothetical protein n=1 Tax=Streptomyces sp. NPDC047706 TaxID=3365486 RepID=UPI0037220F78
MTVRALSSPSTRLKGMCSRPGPGSTDTARRPPGSVVTVTRSPLISRTVAEESLVEEPLVAAAGRAAPPAEVGCAVATAGTPAAASTNPAAIAALRRLLEDISQNPSSTCNSQPGRSCVEQFEGVYELGWRKHDMA